MTTWGLIGLLLLTIAVSAGLTWWVRIGRRRRRSGPGDERAVRLTPIPADDQEAVRALLAEGEEARAAMELSRSGGLPLRHLETATDLLARGGSLPASYAEAADRLRDHEPELARRLERIAREQGPMAATHRLMAEIPLGMVTAQGVIAALQADRWR